MKKLFILCWAFILLGCSKGQTLDVKAVAFLHYDDLILAEEQLFDVKALINNITFSSNVIDDDYKTYIYVITDSNILEIFVSSHNNMLLINNGIRYYSNDVKQITALMTYLQNIHQMYTDSTFYTIKDIEEYFYNNNDVFIEANKTNYYIVIKSQVNIFNFKITEIETNDGEINDTNQLYSKSYIAKDKNIVIRINKPDSIYKYRFTFDTPYGYNISIIPYYDISKEKIEFTKLFQQKEAL